MKKLKTKAEKIKFLNDLKIGKAKICDLQQPSLEIWFKDETGYLYYNKIADLTLNKEQLSKRENSKNMILILTRGGGCEAL